MVVYDYFPILYLQLESKIYKVLYVLSYCKLITLVYTDNVQTI